VGMAVPVHLVKAFLRRELGSRGDRSARSRAAVKS
jgi:hypothetical protein